MSKTVKFEIQGFDERSITDSMSNVKKVSKGLQKIFETIDKIDEQAKKDPNLSIFAYQDALSEVLIENVSAILGISKTESKKLEDVSYSELENFYGKLCYEFVGMEMPTFRQMIEAQQARVNAPESDEPVEDPKSQEEK